MAWATGCFDQEFSEFPDFFCGDEWDDALKWASIACSPLPSYSSLNKLVLK
jgi:hypothetical protein